MLNDLGYGYVSRCAGIPKYPAVYSREVKRPDCVSEEEERIIGENCKKFIDNFFKEYYGDS